MNGGLEEEEHEEAALFWGFCVLFYLFLGGLICAHDASVDRKDLVRHASCSGLNERDSK